MAADSFVQPRSRGRARLGLATVSAAALAWATFASPRARLVYNASDSVALGWYRIEPSPARADTLPAGVLVLARLPPAAAAQAARRGYLPGRTPLLKPVAAVTPQTVCLVAGLVRIDGAPVAAVLRTDRRGRPLRAWPACRRLRPGELFLLSTTNPASFDSRYFGPIRVADVLGVAHPLGREARR